MRKDKQNKTTKKYLHPRGQFALGMILYIVFAMITLANTNWTYHILYEQFIDDYSFNQLSNKTLYNGPGTYVASMGLVPMDKKECRAILFWEGPENYVKKYNFEGVEVNSGNLTTAVIQKMSNDEQYSVYGRFALGLHSLDPFGEDNQPGTIWQTEGSVMFGGKLAEPKLIMPIPDIDGDKIPEIFVSAGIIRTNLPELSVSQMDSYFRNNPDYFLNYYRIISINEWVRDQGQENETTFYQQVAVVPNYLYYVNSLFNGATGERLRNSTGSYYNFGNQSINDAVLMNGENDIFSANWDLTDDTPELVLLESTLDRAIYQSNQFYYQNTIHWSNLSKGLHWNDTIAAYYLSNGTRAWRMDSNQLNLCNITLYKEKDYFFRYENPFPTTEYFNSIKSQSNITIPLSALGFRKLTNTGKGFMVEFYANQYFSEAVSLSFVFSGSGSLLWSKFGALIVGTKDFDEDGYFNFAQYQLLNNGTYKAYKDTMSQHDLLVNYYRAARVALLNSTTGITMAMFDFDIHNPSSPFVFNNSTYAISRIGLGFSSDDLNNDKIPEFVGWVTYNQTYNNIDANSMMKNNGEYPIRPFRIELNTSTYKMIIGKPSLFIGLSDAINPNELSSFRNIGQVQPLNLDMDGDQVVDYIFGWDNIFYKKMGLISGKCNNLDINYDVDNLLTYTRNGADRGLVVSKDVMSDQSIYSSNDFRRISEVIIIQPDQMNSTRINGILGNLKGISFFEDIRIHYDYYEPEKFSTFFPGFSLPLIIGSVIALIICAIIVITAIKPKPKEEVRLEVKRMDRLTQFTAILLFGTLLTIEIFLLVIVKAEVEFSEAYVGPQASLLWFILIYPFVFPLFAILPLLYSYLSPYFAEKSYLKFQKAVFWPRMLTKQLDYKIAVTQMDERKNTSKVTYVMRALLPILIALTIGLTVYQGLAADGFITTIIQIFNPEFMAQSNPNNLGIIQPNTSFNSIWVELGKYARYCIFPMIISFFITAYLIPSGWLLDDAGVVFRIRYKKSRGINDVESVANWITGLLSGIFSISALISFFTLFQPFFAGINDLMIAIQENIPGTQGYEGVLIFVLTLIVFPVLMGYSLMLACITKVEADLHPNTARLFKRMQKMGIDVTPVDIAAVLNAKVGNKPWSQAESDDVTADSKEDDIKTFIMRLETPKDETIKLAAIKQISETISSIPSLLEEFEPDKAIELLRKQVEVALANKLQDTMIELEDKVEQINKIKDIVDIVQRDGKLTSEQLQGIFQKTPDSIDALMTALTAGSDQVKYENGELIITNLLGLKPILRLLYEF